MFSSLESTASQFAAGFPFHTFLSQSAVLKIIKNYQFLFLYLSTLTLKQLGNSIKQLYVYTVLLLFNDFKVKEELYA